MCAKKINVKLALAVMGDNDIICYLRGCTDTELRSMLLTTPGLINDYCRRVCRESCFVIHEDRGSGMYSSNDTCTLLPEYKCVQGLMVHKMTGRSFLAEMGMERG